MLRFKALNAWGQRRLFFVAPEREPPPGAASLPDRMPDRSHGGVCRPVTKQFPFRKERDLACCA